MIHTYYNPILLNGSVVYENLFFINAPGLKEKKLQQKQINLYTHVINQTFQIFNLYFLCAAAQE